MKKGGGVVGFYEGSTKEDKERLRVMKNLDKRSRRREKRSYWVCGGVLGFWASSRWGKV